MKDQDRDVDFGQVGPEVCMPGGNAGDRPRGRRADGQIPRGLDGLGADPRTQVDVKVEEVVVPLGEVGETVRRKGRPKSSKTSWGHPAELPASSAVRGDAETITAFATPSEP